MENVMRNNIISRIEKNSETSNKLAQIANQSTPILEMLGGIVVALVCMYCGYRVITLGDDPGRFMSFLSAFLLIFTPAKRLSRINIDLATEMEAAHRISSLLDATATEPDDFDLPSISITAGKIEFSNVNFAYRPDVPILKNISFVAERGKLIALVGPSGSGKSTIMSLLMRFYVLDSGEIKIDEQNIESVSRHSLRTQIAYVGQDVFLFRGSVRENILVGKPDATVIEIENAARAALAHEFIVALPQGYETDIGEMGMKLSLGQRQRISIARAILKDAHIVLLDEATASLDSESEAAVQAALTRLCSGRTTIAIAHRLSAIRHADCIYFIEDGKIVEIGNEKDLLRKKGRYESFFKIQFSENMKSQNHDAI
jgi:ATP-binding cassette subfamily B protein